MLKLSQILVSHALVAGSMVVLGGCGQKGELYHPPAAAATHRATLPETLTPQVLKATPPEKPASAP
jgi:predicted small lipoprotein YifL